MEQKQDGGPAFPSGIEAGMALRDYFAGQALPVILAPILASAFSDEEEARKGTTTVARAAYEMADAMLAARSAA